MIKKDSLWFGGNSVLFKVVETFEKAGDRWVKYINYKSKQEYTCRAAAFEQRFKRYENHQYSG
jgi:hypothetical protein